MPSGSRASLAVTILAAQQNRRDVRQLVEIHEVELDPQSLQRLVNHIEENLRASMRTGLSFVDPRGHQDRILTRQNHVAFGRRGAGKSTLLRSITDSHHLAVPVNLEDYKDVTFPNIIIQILRAIITELRAVHRRRRKLWWARPSGRALDRRLKSVEAELGAELLRPDHEDIEIRTKSATSAGASLGSEVPGATVGAELGRQAEKSETRSVSRDKLTFLKNELPGFKRLVSDAVEIMKGDALFLVLDDFYFVQKAIQPDCIDFFHRMTKDTPLYLKVGTIRHRTRLMRRASGQTVGVELGHDVLEVDMDYMLDRFEELQAFMKQLLVMPEMPRNALARPMSCSRVRALPSFVWRPEVCPVTSSGFSSD